MEQPHRTKGLVVLNSRCQKRYFSFLFNHRAPFPKQGMPGPTEIRRVILPCNGSFFLGDRCIRELVDTDRPFGYKAYKCSYSQSELCYNPYGTPRGIEN